MNKNIFFIAVFFSVSFFTQQACSITKRTDNCLVIDYDDTILPTSYINKHKIEEYPRYAKESLFKRIDHNISNFLRSVSGYKIYIITNATREWFFPTAKTYLPQFFNIRRDKRIPIISARTLALQEDEKTPVTDWKTIVFQKKLKSCKEIINIGDAYFEHAALDIMLQKQPDIVAKHVWFATEPSAKELELEWNKLSASWELISEADDIFLSTGWDRETFSFTPLPLRKKKLTNQFSPNFVYEEDLSPTSIFPYPLIWNGINYVGDYLSQFLSNF